ncbi:universal stress protein [Spirosoma koreense]
MKTIILATDFSLNSRRAARFAGQLAYDQKATLILFHAFHVWPDNPAKTGDFPLSVKAMRESSEKSLQKMADELRDLLGPTFPIRCIVQEGHTINAIRSVAAAEKADLLVMSTVGTAPASTQLLGSIATGMVAETAVPLLLVPPTVGYAGLKNTVLCIDLDNSPNAVAFDKVVQFARAFESMLNVLCISDKPTDPGTHREAEAIRRLLGRQPHTLTIETDTDLYNAILTFAHTTKADLIMMLPQNRSWFWKLFWEGETQHLARLTDIPLLAIV